MKNARGSEQSPTWPKDEEQSSTWPMHDALSQDETRGVDAGTKEQCVSDGLHALSSWRKNRFGGFLQKGTPDLYRFGTNKYLRTTKNSMRGSLRGEERGAGELPVPVPPVPQLTLAPL